MLYHKCFLYSLMKYSIYLAFYLWAFYIAKKDFEGIDFEDHFQDIYSDEMVSVEFTFKINYLL